MAIGANQAAVVNSTVITGGGISSRLNMTAATVVKAAAGRIVKVNVMVAGSGTGSVNNCATTGAVAAANAVFVIPTTVGTYDVDFPCSTGIVVTPGTGQTIAVSYA